MSLRCLLAVAGGLLCGAPPASAVQFRVLGWDADDYSLRLDQGRSTLELQVMTERLSSLYDAPGKENLVFYRLVDRDGEPVKQPVCTITVPSGLERGVLILVPSVPPSSWIRPPGATGDMARMRVPPAYKHFWLDDSPEARPPGMIDFRNLQDLPIALRVGGRDIHLPPQGREQTPLIPGAKRLDFKAAALLDGEWRLFASSPLPTRNLSRLLVIFRGVSVEPRTGPADTGIRMVRLCEIAPPPKSVAATGN